MTTKASNGIQNIILENRTNSSIAKAQLIRIANNVLMLLF